MVSRSFSWAIQACDWMVLETSGQTPPTEKPLTRLNILMLMVSLGYAIHDFDRLSPEVWKSLGVTLQKVYRQLSFPKLLVISSDNWAQLSLWSRDLLSSHIGGVRTSWTISPRTVDRYQKLLASRGNRCTHSGHLLGGGRRGKLTPLVPGHWQLTTKGLQWAL